MTGADQDLVARVRAAARAARVAGVDLRALALRRLLLADGLDLVLEEQRLDLGVLRVLLHLLVDLADHVLPVVVLALEDRDLEGAALDRDRDRDLARLRLGTRLGLRLGIGRGLDLDVRVGAGAEGEAGYDRQRDEQEQAQC